MFISQAMATETTTAQPSTTLAEDPPSMGEAFLYNAGFILLVVVMFYFLFIRPQQKRMKDHVDMLGQLKIGDAVVTGGGLVGKVSRLIDEKEIEVDLGEMKVVALRSTLLERPVTAKNDNKKPDVKKDDKKAVTK